MPLYFCAILLQVLFENIVLYGFLYFADMSFLSKSQERRKKSCILLFHFTVFVINLTIVGT